MKTARPAMIEALEARIAPATFTVTNINDAGAGSFRQALLNAEANDNLAIIDVINFNIPGFGPHTIALNTALPTINEPVSINGQSNPDFEGRPVIELDGSLTAASRGLLINAGNTTVRSLTVNGFDLAGIGIGGVGGVTVQGCFIGTDYTGTVAQPNGGDGINITSPNNIIGGNAGAERNVIAGNAQSGIEVTGNAATGNFIQGNYIGTNLIGSLQIPNSQGVTITGGGSNSIGGTAAGEGNVISGNLVYDVNLTGSSGNLIAGNIVGLDATAKLPLRSKGQGIFLSGASNNNVIGGVTVNARNIIAAHDEPGAIGVFIGGGSGTEVRGNIIGTNSLNDPDLGNVIGLRIASASNVTLADNFISANLTSGISATSVTNLQILTNKIGTTFAGTGDLGNGGNGISMDACVQPSIIGNQISGNALDGMQIFNSSGGIIQGNLLGTNNTGTFAIPNGLAGVAVINCTDFQIGGAGAGEGNLASGNSSNGIFVLGNIPAHGVKVFGNRVGTDSTGEAALPNGQNGIWVNGGSAHQIGGELPGQGNLVSGNGRGILVQGSSNFIRGNIVGLDKDGTTVLPNAGNTGGHGIQISGGNNNVIGGDGPGEGNIFAGNAGHGVFVQAGAGNMVMGNFIGTNSAGAAGLGNALRGVMHPGTASGTLIGGDSPGAKNVISGNLGAGVEVSGAANVIVRGNLIGLAPDGSTPLANQGGIVITGPSANTQVFTNTISGNALFGVAVSGAGATGIQVFDNQIDQNQGAGVMLDGAVQVVVQDNRFASNVGAGIAVITGAGNRLSRNVFSGNTGLPIDLGNDGPTLNDALDADAGPNGLQNALQLIGVARVGGSSLLAATLQSTPNTTYRLEVFAGAGAGQQFVTFVDVALDETGLAPLQLDLGVTPAGQPLSVTVTNLTTGDTSEFSSVAPFVPLLTVGDVIVNETDNDVVSATFTFTLSELPALPVSFAFATQSGTATSGVDFTDMAGTLTPAGLTTTITIPVLADNLAEAAEKFSVLLSNAVNVLILDPAAEGTIANDDSNLVIKPNGKVATWRDLDGDLVTLKSSKSVLSVDDFVFVADGNGGEQLTTLLLADDGPAAAKTRLKFTAKRAPGSPNSDGLVHVGFIDAAGVDLGAVSVSGDLGRIVAGDAVLKTPALAGLVVGSVGFFGLAPQGGVGSLDSLLTGAVGKLAVRGDFVEASFEATGKMGGVAIGGSVSGAAQLASGGALGGVRIGGDFTSAAITAQGNVASLLVGGSVRDSQILAGYTAALVAVNPDAKVGAVRVVDNWIAGDLVAGVTAGADGFFGTGDEAPAAPGVGFVDKTKMFSRIARIQIGGYVAGTAADAGDHFGFTAQQIGQLKIGNIAFPLTKGVDARALGLDGDVQLREVI